MINARVMIFKSASLASHIRLINLTHAATFSRERVEILLLLLLLLLLRRAERILVHLRRLLREWVVKRRRGVERVACLLHLRRRRGERVVRRRGLCERVRHGTPTRGEQRLHLVPVGLDRLHHLVKLLPAGGAHRPAAAVEARAAGPRARGQGHLRLERVHRGVRGGRRERRRRGERIRGGRRRLEHRVGAILGVGDGARKGVGLRATRGLERRLLLLGGGRGLEG